jgi:hypothetical protein
MKSLVLSIAVSSIGLIIVFYSLFGANISGAILDDSHQSNSTKEIGPEINKIKRAISVLSSHISRSNIDSWDLSKSKEMPNQHQFVARDIDKLVNETTKRLADIEYKIKKEQQDNERRLQLLENASQSNSTLTIIGLLIAFVGMLPSWILLAKKSA